MKSELLMSICEQQMGVGQLGAFHNRRSMAGKRPAERRAAVVNTDSAYQEHDSKFPGRPLPSGERFLCGASGAFPQEWPTSMIRTAPLWM